MSKEKREKASLKKSLNCDETVSFLETLLESFKAGKIIVGDAEENVTLIPAGQIDMKLKARVKKQKNKIKMELSWKDDSVKSERNPTEAAEPSEQQEDAGEYSEDAEIENNSADQ